MTSTIFRASLLVASLTSGVCQAASNQADPTFSVGPKFQQKSGEAIYQAICQGCHMEKGQGAKGAGTFPALASNPRLAGADYPLYIVVKGQKGMPSFGDMLDDAQVAAVVGYVRTHFGNQYADPVSAESVANIRR